MNGALRQGKAKHVRHLHLSAPARDGGQTSRHVALRHEHLVKIAREKFLEIAGLDEGCGVDASEKRVLNQWLAARYGRPAFPDSFEAHLRKGDGKHNVEKAIAEIACDDDGLLVGLFLDLGDHRVEDPPAGEPFALRIYVVYDASESSEAARAYGEAVAERLKALFFEAYGPEDAATEIALEKCTAIADIEFTLADIRRTDQWRLEHVSLRQEPPGEFFAAGTGPA